ncbi:MAG TPA: Fur family transcriptional regulator [bacterium]|nr:Fur family transcriptional regulator [bacterium]
MSRDRLSALLRRAGLRVTPQRVAILDTLATGRHLATCQNVWQRAQRRTSGLGLVTAYRILERMRKSGLVEQVDIRGAAHFGLADRHHDHTICQRCGAIEATDGCLLDSLAGKRLRGTGFLVQAHRLDLLGTCQACQRAG